MNYKGHFASKTDRGRVRITNEDQAFVVTNFHGEVLMVVCDGMGGQNKGDYASKMALDYIVERFQTKRRGPVFLSKSWLRRTIREANAMIYDEAQSKPIYADMGTTCVAVLIQGNHLIVANSGDSRAYTYDERGLVRLTQDQTYVDFLYRSGQIAERERDSSPDRHILMNALGIYPSANLDIKVHPYCGETVLLCSDGLYNNVSEPEIRAVLSTDERVDLKVSSLIAEANANGGSDNVGIALWEASRND
ncbi:MAG: Stp1/IreP family PP2C-type Ser/Thr phosphatase [Bacilli bacterium]|nr:Stp1/IreP family PP2C-type Ser/Thr phosphatase [Bacilli bacterium]